LRTRGATTGGLAALAFGFGVLQAGGAVTDDKLEAAAEAGPVEAIVRLSPTEPMIGDALILELEVRAQPDVELLMPEFGEALDRFTVLDFSHSETADAEGGTVSRQRYTLAPPHSGSQAIPQLLVEFVDRRPGRDPAPEGEDAYELLTAVLAFEVTSALADDSPLEFRAPLGELGALVIPGRYRWLWILMAVVVLAAAILFGFRVWVAWRLRVRRRSAYDVARGDLDALIMAPRPNERQMDAFFVQLSGIIRHYLENRFGLRSPELTTEEFLEELARSPDLVRSHQRLLREFLNRADLVKFAHLVPEPGDVEVSLDGARRFLESTRDDAAMGSAVV
jgi:HAMP domain-containing protein